MKFSRRFGSIEQRLEYLAATVEYNWPRSDSSVSDFEHRNAVPAATTSQSFSPARANGEFQSSNYINPTGSLDLPVSNTRSESLGVPRYVTEVSFDDTLVDFGYVPLHNRI